MRTHSEISPPDEKSECAPCSASVIASRRTCAVCGTALTGRPQQQRCSARCLAAPSRRARREELADRRTKRPVFCVGFARC